ncbi:MAG: N-acetylmuramoyl-L-alanine amidase [Candidatus Portnoybacteria bacterium]|nr:N-acetylmuramoyl-L-alanine amidase [Candidatus Portnoybacteria bacterium]
MKILVKKIFLFLFIISINGAIFTFPFVIGEPNAVNAQETSSLVYLDSEIPVIQPRSVWDNSSDLHTMMTWPPQNQEYPSDWQPIERIVMHYTATPTDDDISIVARIQSIYRFHAVTNGWGDIGYNYLIAQDGKIYEGRWGGNGSRGAHAYNSKNHNNYNYGSIGIAFLGTYDASDITQVMYESAGRLIGWLAAANNLNPAETNRNFSIWNSDSKTFSSVYSGPVISGHSDLDSAKPDPGVISLPKIRTLADQYKQKYQGIVYQSPSSSRIYQIANGERKVFETISDFAASGASYQKIISVSQAQLDLFSADRFLKYPSGSLVQVASAPSIYLIDEGKKRNLAITASQFTKLGFDWVNVKKITTGELNLYPEGPNIIYGPDKELLKDPQGKVFYVENGKKRWVTSGGLFGILGYQWSKVKAKPAEYMATILAGANMSYPSGTLLKGSGSTVYLIDNGQKREFLSGQTFVALGYQWGKIITAIDEEVLVYPVGAFMAYKDGTLIKSESDPTVYLVSSGQKRSFISAEQFLNLGYQWKNILTIPAGELSRYVLTGDALYPDGTLVQKVGDFNVYRIEGGLAKLIPDATTFNQLKLSWSKILKISAQDFVRLFPYISASFPVPQSTPSQPPISSSQPDIRVKIWEVSTAQTEVTFTASGPYDVYNKSGNLIASKNSAETYSVNTSNPSGVFVKLVPKAGAFLEAVSYQDLASWKTGLNYNKFRGNLELVYSAKSGKLLLVNELPLEDYLKGVAETNQGLHMEYLKTMSVAARTYAYHYQKIGGKYGSDEVYHITNTTADQLYKGYGREAFASDIVTAAQSTFGEMVVYNNEPIVTAYSSGADELITSGSRSACSVWGGKYCQAGYEYLSGGVKDPEGTTYSYDACGAGNHCVGLSGAGTRQMAALGKTYREILTHYYKGTSIQKIY